MVNANELGYGPDVQVLEGAFNRIMPLLRGCNYAPWSPSDVMDARNKACDYGILSHKRYKDAFWRNHFSTDFGITTIGENIYLLPKSEIVRNVNLQTKLTSEGGIALEDIPEKAQQFKVAELEKILNRPLKKEEAIDHPIWLALADGNKERLEAYAENAFMLKEQAIYDELNKLETLDLAELYRRAAIMGNFGALKYTPEAEISEKKAWLASPSLMRVVYPFQDIPADEAPGKALRPVILWGFNNFEVVARDFDNSSGRLVGLRTEDATANWPDEDSK